VTAKLLHAVTARKLLCALGFHRWGDQQNWFPAVPGEADVSRAFFGDGAWPNYPYRDCVACAARQNLPKTYSKGGPEAEQGVRAVTEKWPDLEAGILAALAGSTDGMDVHELAKALHGPVTPQAWARTHLSLQALLNDGRITDVPPSLRYVLTGR
jgi:hypothetical protein